MKKKIMAVIGIFLLLCLPANACTIFCFTHQGKTYFCNNEDWIDPFTEIAFHPAKDDGYAWVYFGFANGWAQGGVNEHGLCFDWVAGGGPFGWKPDPTKMDFQGNITEEMLRKCKTVEESIELFKRHNVKHLDYSVAFIADKKGNSVLVHWRDGKLRTDKNTDRFHSCGAGKSKVDARLADYDGDPGMIGLADALSAGASRGRGGTKYSTVFSLSEGKIFLFQNRNFDQYLEIDYLKKLRSPQSSHRISSLFLNSKSESAITMKTVKRTEKYNNVRATTDLYLNGVAKNEIEMLSRAFHKEATVQQAGASAEPVNAIDFFRHRMQPGTKSLSEARVVSVNVVGDTAQANLEIDYPTFTISEDLSLKETGDGWKIAGRVFEPIEQDNRASLALAMAGLTGEVDEKTIASFYESEKASEKYYLDEAEMNQVGYDFMWSDRVDAAIAVFKANVDAFPKSANAYDSLGEGYSKNGKRELAIANYEKSLELNPDNPAARAVLQQLKQKRNP